MRHAKAVREHEAPTDKDRGLTDRGRADAARAGQEMAAQGLSPGIALVSSAARTRQTWAAVAAALPDTPADIQDALYLAPSERLWDHAHTALSTHACALLIGHNPGLHELIAELTRQTHDHSRLALGLRDHLPTAAFAAFEIDGDVLDAAAPRLLAAWRPKD
jgi:phosphohistidine phosphatase